MSLHIHRRNTTTGEDPRYQEMAARGGESPARRMFFRGYLNQALAMWFVSLPVQVSSGPPARW